MDKTNLIKILNSLNIDASLYRHYSNIQTKIKNNYKTDNQNIDDFLIQCVKEYVNYHNNFQVHDFSKLTNSWNNYLEFVRERNVFSSQSKFESTILEESIFRMFSHYINNNIKVGSIKAYSNMFFAPSNYQEFIKRTKFKFNVKDQDFAIYKDVSVNIDDTNQIVSVPIVAIECKTYLDKTMLEGSVATADKIKNGNPYCKFYIVTETYEVSTDVDIKSTRIDQIYILRKSKRRNMNQPTIQQDVLERLYKDISNHLNNDWSDTENNIIKNGIIL